MTAVSTRGIESVIQTRIAAVIPARMASTRFPGKPLLNVRGLPMIEHVRRRALMCGRFSEVVVATCDRRIEKCVKQYGGRVMMTSDAHPAATDRVAEAAQHLDCTHVVNVQGDEILVRPRDLGLLVDAIQAAPLVLAWNAIARVTEQEVLRDPSVVKCVTSRTQRILFCSRDFSKLTLASDLEPVCKILGILAYRREFLTSFSGLERTPLERAEAIDQSRILEHDIALQGVTFTGSDDGINKKQDVKGALSALSNDPVQQEILMQMEHVGATPRRETGYV